ncbi:MAG TPA: HD domain-containing protein [Pirellulales bacterium]|nr:HD domain-containing protein [Pirellulales bacterium]
MQSLDSLLNAISFAARAHRGHFRKDGETPYFAHPLRVTMILIRVFGVTDLETLMAAVLHDTIEDTQTDHDELSEQFGSRVADYVAALSKDKRLPEERRERDYHDALAAAPAAVQLCKLADVYDNLLDSRGMDAAARRKKIAKAREAVERFEPTLAVDWQHAVAAVRKAICLAEAQ